MDKVRWGIIGCGEVTEMKSGPAFCKVDNSELVAVMRRDAEKAQDYAHRHHVPIWYSDADKLIEDENVDAVYVATPPDTHAEYSIRALRAGKPVYVEKPMARNYSECLQMIKTSKNTGVPLFVAYYRRALPGFIKIKELIEQGEIGKPLVLLIQLYKYASEEIYNGKLPWRVIPEVSGGGLFFDLASHQLDYFDYLFGPVQKVNGIAENCGTLYSAEDTISASFRFANGVIGTGSWCFVTSTKCCCDRMEISGTKGKISFSCFEFSPIILETETKKEVFQFAKPEHVQFNLINEIVKELTGKGKAPSTGETAARTSWVMDEIIKEYYKK